MFDYCIINETNLKRGNKMERQKFIESTILQLDEELFEEMRDFFVNERYISF